MRIKGNQIKNKEINGNHFNFNIGIYNPLKQYNSGDIVLWNGQLWQVKTNQFIPQGNDENDYSNAPENNNNWKYLTKITDTDKDTYIDVENSENDDDTIIAYSPKNNLEDTIFKIRSGDYDRVIIKNGFIQFTNYSRYDYGIVKFFVGGFYKGVHINFATGTTTQTGLYAMAIWGDEIETKVRFGNPSVLPQTDISNFAIYSNNRRVITFNTTQNPDNMTIGGTNSNIKNLLLESSYTNHGQYNTIIRGVKIRHDTWHDQRFADGTVQMQVFGNESDNETYYNDITTNYNIERNDLNKVSIGKYWAGHKLDVDGVIKSNGLGFNVEEIDISGTYFLNYDNFLYDINTNNVELYLPLIWNTQLQTRYYPNTVYFRFMLPPNYGLSYLINTNNNDVIINVTKYVINFVGIYADTNNNIIFRTQTTNEDLNYLLNKKIYVKYSTEDNFNGIHTVTLLEKETNTYSSKWRLYTNTPLTAQTFDSNHDGNTFGLIGYVDNTITINGIYLFYSTKNAIWKWIKLGN